MIIIKSASTSLSVTMGSLLINIIVIPSVVEGPPLSSLAIHTMDVQF
jgi:hypothetical protein